ncbi:MAG: YlbF family regulator [Acholeplasmatales bacterium]|nr:YlbF family regulator [Acholeplasmatales bacterium]
MNSKDKLIEYFNSLPEVKRIKELEHYIDNNEKIKNAFKEIKALQKQMVSSKEFNQMNQYNMLKKEYDNKLNEYLDLPFVSEYCELLEYVNNLLSDLSFQIETDISKKING